ncbi:transcription antitermination factor NusB [Bacillus hwajinpoensis]|jgi:transcription antitermination protein NusB|uniref:Transcription antitermination protein NusB n=1 Tax=Guptibacillus hwajinpoensis TaxID=208199 RepID=A0A845EXC6_9BACL|nr:MULTISPECIES: transcription antitermination factor NusB [Bacillaceae]MCA0990989.1 transcription antitermination factor NusB [Pseudalkalibacillus hwajinpoensis]MYL63163.1 transcription antitermination factor NusB [Pseudalkalibacillus hwajinpoensis]QHA92511.1 transcription antitermination factor NusB [Bacillus sp. N1-1]
MKRRHAREKAIQVLFQIDVTDTDPREALQHVLNEGEGDEFLSELVFGTLENLEKIDAVIKENLVNWTFSRIGNVDRSVLRMASYEIVMRDDIPVNVSLNEAVELAKLFGGEESGRFVNGVLSKIIQKS